jgi:serine protease Do
VSALARSTLSINDFNFFIQTDAAINPGNSGGPLVSMKGGIVGINSAIFSRDGGSLGIGFAIPSEMVATTLSAAKSGRLDKKGGIIRPWVGVTVQDVTADIAAGLNLKTPSGALIAALHPESPALKAGLKVGDLVTDVNGRKIHDASELRFRFAMVPIGESAKIGYTRKGKAAEAEIQAIVPPDSPDRASTLIKGRNPLGGATLSNINPALSVELGLKDEDTGVVVSAVTKNSIASQVVAIGDVIVAINGESVKSPTDVQAMLDKPARGWSVKIRSAGKERTLFVRS